MTQLVARRVADRRDEVRKCPLARQARGEARLEPRSGRERSERGPHDRGSVDERRQLRPNGGIASGQKAVDGLIQAFGRRAGWQSGSPSIGAGVLT